MEKIGTKLPSRIHQGFYQSWSWTEKATMQSLLHELFEWFLVSVIKRQALMSTAAAMVKIKDHCHDTSIYQGVSHTNCNLNYWIPDHTPIVFENPIHYEAHLFIKVLQKSLKKDVGVIAETKENCISFNVMINIRHAGVIIKKGKEVHKNIQLRFIDSFRFMVSRLNKLEWCLMQELQRVYKRPRF